MHYEEFKPVKILIGDLLSDLVGNFVVLRVLVTKQNETAGFISGETECVWLISEY